MAKRKGRWLFIIPFVIFVAGIFFLRQSMFFVGSLLFVAGGVVTYLMTTVRGMDEKNHRDSETY